MIIRKQFLITKWKDTMKWLGYQMTQWARAFSLSLSLSLSLSFSLFLSPNYQIEHWSSFVLTGLLYREMTSFATSVVSSFVSSGDVTCDVTRRHVTWRHWRYHAVWRDEVVTGQIRLLVTSRHVLSIPWCQVMILTSYHYQEKVK